MAALAPSVVCLEPGTSEVSIAGRRMNLKKVHGRLNILAVASALFNVVIANTIVG